MNRRDLFKLVAGGLVASQMPEPQPTAEMVNDWNLYLDAGKAVRYPGKPLFWAPYDPDEAAQRRAWKRAIAAEQDWQAKQR